jgi:hypothetical protein
MTLPTPNGDGADIDAILGVQASPQREARNRASDIPLQGNPRHVRRPSRRLFVNALRAKSAAEALAGLPADGETWHCLMTGDFDSFDLVPAMLDHARPALIEDLHLASLGFNHANARRLLELMDAGLVRRCTMIVSLYYEADPKEADTCYTLARELPARGVPGGWYCATRSHAKVIAARFTDGRCFVIESSANLRTCRNLEQFAITQDHGLFDFHHEWMESVHEHEARRTSRD